MGVLLKWKKPTAEADYDTVRIYRSDSETGTYVVIHSQTITDSSYYDPNGNANLWYKIDFYDSILEIASSFSAATQGQERIGYATVDEVRVMTNIKSNQVTDTELALMIDFAAAKVNNDISHEIEDEKVESISDLKPNDIDGETIRYYTKNFPIADYNNDFKITSDDIKAYSVDSEGNTNDLVVTQVDAETGEFYLSEAPEDVDVFISYKYTDGILVDPVHDLIKLACIQLTAAYGYSKVNLGKAPRFKQGPLTVFRDTTAHKQYMQQYYSTLNEISKLTKQTNYGD